MTVWHPMSVPTSQCSEESEGGSGLKKYQDSGVESRSGLVNAVSTLIIIALFAIAALVLVSAGMQVYNNVVLASNENFELRTSLSYVATKIANYDASGAVKIEDHNGIKALTMLEDIDGDEFVTVIYHKNGALYEFTQYAGEELQFDAGFEVIEIDSFDMLMDGSAITLTAANASGAAETLTTYLRSE